MPELDDDDQRYLDTLTTSRAQLDGPQVGDYVVYADDVTHRIGTLTTATDGTPLVETYEDGSFHLDETGYGSAEPLTTVVPTLPVDQLTDSGDTLAADFWIWRHGKHHAGNGIDIQTPVRIWTTSHTST